jgi:hypothetical protein
MTLHDADTAVRLRQDSGPFCLLLLGLVVFSSYIFNYFYLGISIPATWLIVAQYFLFLVGLPLLMIFFLVGYFRPEKGKAKNTAMSISVVVAFFFVVFVYFFADALYVFPTVTSEANIGFYYSVWGLAGVILTAAGFSIMHNLEESTSPGILDTSKLHYGPEPEPEPEPEAEVEGEVEGAPAEVETTPKEEESVPEAEEETPAEAEPEAE